MVVEVDVARCLDRGSIPLSSIVRKNRLFTGDFFLRKQIVNASKNLEKA